MDIISNLRTKICSCSENVQYLSPTKCVWNVFLEMNVLVAAGECICLQNKCGCHIKRTHSLLEINRVVTKGKCVCSRSQTSLSHELMCFATSMAISLSKVKSSTNHKRGTYVCDYHTVPWQKCCIFNRGSMAIDHTSCIAP